MNKHETITGWAICLDNGRLANASGGTNAPWIASRREMAASEAEWLRRNGWPKAKIVRVQITVEVDDGPCSVSPE